MAEIPQSGVAASLTGGPVCSGYAKLFGAISSDAAARSAVPALRMKRSRAYTAPDGGSESSSSPRHVEHSLHSEPEMKHEVPFC